MYTLHCTLTVQSCDKNYKVLVDLAATKYIGDIVSKNISREPFTANSRPYFVPPFRELTEPECDRDQDGLEDISGEQLQMELEKIIQDYRRDKQKLHNTEKSKQEKFIISV